MEHPLKILLLEDDPDDAEIIQRLLKKGKISCEFRLAMNKESFLKAIDDFSPDVILSDNSLPQFNARDALRITRVKHKYTPFILVTGTVSEEYAADIIKEGADDYILKDRMARLHTAIEAALKKRRATREIEDYKYALDQSSIVAITDQKGIIVYANNNFCKISEYTVDELVGQDHRIVNSGHHSPAFIRYLWDTIANGNIWRGEFRNKAKAGNLYWVDTTIIPFLDDKGNPYQYLAIGIDITERKNIEQELQKSNERFKYATRATTDIIWELNFEARQYLVHEGKERLFGTNKALNWQLGIDGEYVFDEDRERVRKSFHEARINPERELWEEEYRVYTDEHVVLHIVNHAIFIRGENGKVLRVIGAISDITEKKKLELALFEQQRKEQLRITATALEAQEKERNSIGQELHDNVNQILVGTKLFLSMIKNDTKKNQSLLMSCMTNIQDAIEENRRIAHVLVAPDFESKNLVDQVSSLTDKMLVPFGIDVHLDSARFRESLLSDNQKLAIYRIAQEQCTNIAKYAKARLVNISLVTEDSAFIMVISDDGEGMQPGGKTTGIGLKNIKGRLSIFNGTAHIDTAPGKGFTLKITMPLNGLPVSEHCL